MSDELEPRLDVELPVRVFGMGADGRPFLHNAQARNISRHGAKLFGLEAQLKPGDVIGVQVGDKKARASAENLSGREPGGGATLSLGKGNTANPTGVSADTSSRAL
jgi:hypothetical protein